MLLSNDFKNFSPSLIATPNLKMAKRGRLGQLRRVDVLGACLPSRSSHKETSVHSIKNYRASLCVQFFAASSLIVDWLGLASSDKVGARHNRRPSISSSMRQNVGRVCRHQVGAIKSRAEWLKRRPLKLQKHFTWLPFKNEQRNLTQTLTQAEESI